MPIYTVVKGKRMAQVTMSFAEYDQAVEDGTQFVVRPDGAPVSIFTGPGFTRRSTDSRANRNIDHSDWRGGESWPGDPKKKAGRPKKSNWTKDDFRKKGI